MLLSSLAEGADRLAARVALRANMQLVAVLPLPQDRYEDDFAAPGSIDEFRGLLARSIGVIRLPLLDGSTEDQIAQSGPARDREYAKVGAYIAAHSQVFFAFWDGTPDAGDKIGGTAHTVGFRLRGAPAGYGADARTRMSGVVSGPVLHIATPRASNLASASLAVGLERLLPPNTREDAYDRICARMNGFNRDAKTLSDTLTRGVRDRLAGLLNMAVSTAPSTFERLPAGCRKVVEHYLAADGLALQFRARALSSLIRVYIGVAAAALFFNFHSSFFLVGQEPPASFADLVSALPWFLIGSLACSAFTGAWLYERAEKREYQSKYLDYRALAEALRIQFFWKIAGIAEPVVDRYLRRQRSDLEWIRSALRSCDVMVAAAGPPVEVMGLSRAERLGLIAKWIEDQRRYYSSRARSERAKLERDFTIVTRLLKLSGALSIVLAALLIVPLLTSALVLPQIHRLTPGPVQHGWWMVLIPMVAVSAGLLHGYGKQLARAEHARQFERMTDLFYAAECELSTVIAEDREDAAALVRELGMEALDENGDWLILHRERPLEVPPV